MQSIFVFLDIVKAADFNEKMLCQQNSRIVSRNLLYLLDRLFVRYNCAKFHHCRICVTNFRKEWLFGPAS